MFRKSSFEPEAYLFGCNGFLIFLDEHLMGLYLSYGKSSGKSTIHPCFFFIFGSVDMMKILLPYRWVFFFANPANLQSGADFDNSEECRFLIFFGIGVDSPNL